MSKKRFIKQFLTHSDLFLVKPILSRYRQLRLISDIAIWCTLGWSDFWRSEWSLIMLHKIVWRPQFLNLVFNVAFSRGARPQKFSILTHSQPDFEFCDHCHRQSSLSVLSCCRTLCLKSSANFTGKYLTYDDKIKL